MKTLWRIYLYSRYGKEQTLGYAWYDGDTVPPINRKAIMAKIDGQPCAICHDIVKQKEN